MALLTRLLFILQLLGLAALASASSTHLVARHGPAGDDGDGDDDSDDVGVRGSQMLRTNIHIVHGVIMSAAFVIFFPIGAILMRVLSGPNALLIHRIVQMVGYGVMLLGFAMGAWLSWLHNEVCWLLTIVMYLC